MMRKNSITKISALLLFLLSFAITHKVKAQNPPELKATGDQEYCPLSTIPIVTNFSLTNPSGNVVRAVYIQISFGYQRGSDFLELPPNPNLSTNFDIATGKLTLAFNPAVSTTEIEDAVKAVTYRSNSATVSGERIFSITIGQANYLPSTGHYYMFIPSNLITWQDARVAAENSRYYGLQGYLATLTSREEAILCGEQSQGSGWIGGTDEQTEGVWKWVTGPEAANGGLIFWNGKADGNTPNFAFWNTNEPNDANGGEDYAHITAPNIGTPGAWNDLRTTGEQNTDYQAKGYIVEYGGMPGDPKLNIAVDTRIFIPEITATTGDTRCGPGVVTLSATSNGTTLNWYTAASGGTPVFTGDTYTPTITSTQDFYVAAEAAGCLRGKRTSVRAVMLDDVVAANQITFTNCDEDGTPDGFTNFNLEEAIPFITSDLNTTVTFYSNSADADLDSNSIRARPYNNRNGQTVFARTTAASGCYKVTRIDLAVSVTSLPTGYEEQLDTCDTDGTVDGFATFDLTQATNRISTQFPTGRNFVVSYFRTEEDALLEQNEILPQNAYKNEISDQQVLFARVEDNTQGSCYAIGPYVRLNVEPIPVFELADLGSICVTDPNFTLQTINAQDVYTYEWRDQNNTLVGTNPELVITSPGTYTVTAQTLFGCNSEVKEITVIASESATLTRDNIAVTTLDGQTSLSIVNVSALGAGDYEYTLDEALGPYQDSPVFEQVSPGLRTLYIRDKNGCGISSIQIPVLGFAKFFTPNNDGYHDTWTPLGLSKTEYSAVTIYIYDRFGKLLKSIYGFDNGWDGTTRGVALPSSDYWYTVTLTDINGVISEFKGHMTLKR
ncbi:T9SS type B sorting domain-containing protein [Leeuwenhoekiella sp. NPDC079379]|uniref:T9SS type B sorting domain-containing protein n=1 Tax=Leeuwenhoekiella sp. NPDC079379 TaxID=3364122 RepID=UPI0037CB5AA9